MKRGKVLLLGGTGTLSASVLKESISCGYDVTVMNRGLTRRVFDFPVKSILCDFTNTEDIINKFAEEQYDVIVDFLSRRELDIERVYPFFSKRCKQYVFISSSCVYKRENKDFPIVESSPKPNSDWSYNVDKYKCEKKLIELTGVNNKYTIIRPYITYDDERIPFGITPSYHYHRTILERFRSGKPWIIWDEGRAITTITHTSDFARAVVGLFLNVRAYNEDFHITSDFSCTQKHLFELFASKIGVKPNYVSFDTAEIVSTLPEYKGLLLGDRSLNAIFDNSKIKNAIPGFTFKMDIDKGLDRVISYWNNSDNFDYDYVFEARLDRLISKKRDVHYVCYNKASKKQCKIYYIYRHLPIKIASRIIGK